MAYKIRVSTSKEQLKKPDEFIGAVDWLGEKIRTHAKLAWTILGGVLIVGAGIGAYGFYLDQQKSRAASLEYLGLQYYRQQAPADDKSPAPSKEENYKKAIDQFQKILQDYPRTPSASLAPYYLGNAYMDLKNFDSAISSYRTFLEKNPKNDILAGITYQRLGYAYLAKNSLEEARKAFESVGPLAGALNRDQANYELGRIQEVSGQKDEAIKRYQDLVKQYPDSLFFSDAQKRLTALGVPETKPEQINPSVLVSPGEKPITVVPAPQQKPAQGESPMPAEKK